MSPSTSPAVQSYPTPEYGEYSVPAWKAVPSTWDVFFSLRLPYRAPESPIAAYFWRKRVWFEVTFALTMMEPWEKMLLVLILTIISALFSYTFTYYFPVHLHFVLARAKYYFLGIDLPVAMASSATSTVSPALEDGSAYSLGVLGDYAYGGVEKLGEFVSTWRLWNSTAL